MFDKHSEPSHCQFDGRLSAVWHNGRFILYARANLAVRGARFVQATTSRDGRVWTAMTPIRLPEYEPFEGNIYFFLVQPNPVCRDSLLAIFPVVHGARGCLTLAASADGLRWTSASPLIPCNVDVLGDRTADHAAGLVDAGDWVHVYVHNRVPDIVVRGDHRRSSLARHAIARDELRRWSAKALADVESSSDCADALP